MRVLFCHIDLRQLRNIPIRFAAVGIFQLTRSSISKSYRLFKKKTKMFQNQEGSRCRRYNTRKEGNDSPCYGNFNFLSADGVEAAVRLAYSGCYC